MLWYFQEFHRAITVHMEQSKGFPSLNSRYYMAHQWIENVCGGGGHIVASYGSNANVWGWRTIYIYIYTCIHSYEEKIKVSNGILWEW